MKDEGSPSSRYLLNGLVTSPYPTFEIALTRAEEYLTHHVHIYLLSLMVFLLCLCIFPRSVGDHMSSVAVLIAQVL